MSYCKLGVIVSHMPEEFLESRQSQMVSTPWGEAEVYTSLVNGVNTAVIPRCRDHADMASHLVNFRSNTWGSKKSGVKQIISQNIIGSYNPYIRSGNFVVPDDAMGFTKKRVPSFFGDYARQTKMDTSEPFYGNPRGYLLETRADEQIPVCSTDTFICTESPRFEAPTEIRYYNSIGGDTIGTPMSPELVLAKEVGVYYTSLSMVIDVCTGMGPAIYQGDGEGLMTAYEKNGIEDKVECVPENLAGRPPERADCLYAGLPERGFFGIRPE